jgi:hypothetical protein
MIALLTLLPILARRRAVEPQSLIPDMSVLLSYFHVHFPVAEDFWTKQRNNKNELR